MAQIENLESLVARAQQGDPDALEQLLAACQPALQRLARRACPSSHAEDAVQEVLCRMAMQVGALRVAKACLVWSLRMLARECLRMHRQVARFVLGLPRESVEAERLDEYLDVVRALSTMTPDARAILLHREILGRTAPEAATELGIGVEATKTRLRRARAELRAALQQ